MKRRRRRRGCFARAASFLMSLILLSAAACAVLAFYAWHIEPQWIDISRHKIKSPAYPADAPPLKIALIADTHFGPKNDDAFIRRAVAKANALQPDIALLAGDYLSDIQYATACAQALGGLSTASGTFAVFGGHDYQQGEEILTREFQNAGIRVMKNGNAKIGRNTFLITLDDRIFGRPDIEKAYRRVPRDSVRIVLTHTPRAFPDIRDRNSIVLSGHTHAGQLDIPGIPRNQLPGLMSYEYIRGWYHDGDSTLYVNRGLGTVIPYMRFRARPEISLFTISNGAPDYTGMKTKDALDKSYPLRRFLVRGFRLFKPFYMKVRTESVD